MGETSEELKLRLTMDTQQAINIAKSFRAEVEKMKASVRGVATEAKVSFKEAAEAMVTAFSSAKMKDYWSSGASIGENAKNNLARVRAEIDRYTKVVKTAAQEMTQVEGDAFRAFQKLNKTTSSFKSAITSIAAGFGIFAGWQMLTDLIRGVTNALKEAAQAAYDFSKSVFALQAGINAMRRAGVDITFEDMMGNIKELRKEFKQFSTVELVQGSAELINLSRDFGATKEQIFELQDAIVKLAIINGRAMDDVQRTVALALSSGYTEGLQRLGVSINRVTIAEEAQRLGFGRNYLALTEQQRYLATQNILLEKTAKYQDDLNKYMETAPGTIDATKAAWKDLSAVMGTYLLPIWGMFMSVAGRVLNFTLRTLKEAIPAIFSNFVRPLATAASVASQLWEILLGKRAIQDFDMAEVNAKVSKAIKNLTEGIKEDIANAGMELPEAEIEMPIREMSLDDLKTYQDFFRELYDMQDASEGKLKELAIEFGEDMLEIDADWQQESKEAWADYQKELAEIAQKEKDDIAEAEKDLAKDIADLNRDAQRDEADAARKYRENEIKAERDYQEKLRRLKEEFLYDLEDALRERDALQVLRLIRRYKLDVEQLQRQNEEERQERQDSYRQELEDIRRQKEEKLRELQEEHAERLAEIQAQAEKEREEAANAYAEKIAELNAQYVQERADRQAQYEQDKQDLVDALEAQVQAAIQKFIEMNNLTGDQVALLSATLKNVFGAGGSAEGAFNEFGLNLQNLTLLAELEVNKIRSYLEQLATSINMIGLYSSALPTTTPGNPLGVAGGANLPTTLPSSVPGYASGVQNMLLTRPHLFMAGEVPEVMNITPVSQLSSGKSGGSGKGTLEISLSEGLVGTIIDNTLGEVAIVMKDRLR